MRIFITGDIHGENDCITKLGAKRWPMGKTLCKNDLVIIAGDFGLFWFDPPRKSEKHWLKWLSNRPWTTVFIDGNHENHDLLDQLELTDFCGGLAGRAYKDIYHLKRGEIYILNGLKFFTFGGAQSTDIEGRKKGVNYWSREVASEEEMQKGFRNLKIHDNKVDYIISHTAPRFSLIEYMAYLRLGVSHLKERLEDPTAAYLEDVCNQTEYKKLFCGHMHDDIDINKTRFIYLNIEEVT